MKRCGWVCEAAARCIKGVMHNSGKISCCGAGAGGPGRLVASVRLCAQTNTCAVSPQRSRDTPWDRVPAQFRKWPDPPACVPCLLPAVAVRNTLMFALRCTNSSPSQGEGRVRVGPGFTLTRHFAASLSLRGSMCLACTGYAASGFVRRRRTLECGIAMPLSQAAERPPGLRASLRDVTKRCHSHRTPQRLPPQVDKGHLELRR